MVNTVLILLKQSEDESSTCSRLKSENTTEGLNECTREQRKNDEEGKFYSFKAYEFPSN